MLGCWRSKRDAGIPPARDQSGCWDLRARPRPRPMPRPRPRLRLRPRPRPRPRPRLRPRPSLMLGLVLCRCDFRVVSCRVGRFFRVRISVSCRVGFLFSRVVSCRVIFCPCSVPCRVWNHPDI